MYTAVKFTALIKTPALPSNFEPRALAICLALFQIVKQANFHLIVKYVRHINRDGLK